MAGNIKGITVEIGGNTTGLSAALKDVDDKARALTSELRAVEKALKLDPTNVTLLAEKQKILNEQAANTAERLKKIEEVQGQVNEQFKNGEIGEDAYKAFTLELGKTQAELTNTETKLDAMSDSADDTDKEVVDLTKAVKDSGDTADKAGDKFAAFGVIVGDIAKMAATATAAIGAAAAAAAVKLATQVVSQFGELEQNLGGSEAVFGDYASAIQRIGEDAYKNMGVAQSEYLATANKMGALFQGSGIEQLKSLEYTHKAMQRAADMASVMGIETSAALEAVTGAAKGNYAMMDNLGIAMNATTLEAYAVAKGLNVVWKEATNAEKADIAMQYFFENTEQYAGNFARESTQTISGSLGLLQASVSSLVAGLGNANADMTNLAGNVTDAFQAVVSNVTPILENIVSVLPTAINTIVSAIGDMLPTLLTAGKDIFSQVLSSIVSLLPDLIPVIVEAMMMVVNTLVENLPLFIDAMGQVIATMGDGIVESLPQLIPAIMAIISSIADNLMNSLPQIMEMGKEILSAVISGITNEFPALEPIINTLGGMFSNVSGMLSSMFDSVTSSGIFDTVISLFNELGGVVMTVMTSISESSMFESLAAIFDQIIEKTSILMPDFTGLGDLISNVIVQAIEILSGALEFVVEHFDAVSAVVVAVTAGFAAFQTAMAISSIVQKVITVVKGAADAFKVLSAAMIANPIGIVVAAISALVAGFLYLWNTNDEFKEAVINIWNAVKDFFINTFEAIKDLFEKVWGGIKDFFEPVINWFSEIINHVFGGVKDFVDKNGSEISEIFTKIWQGIKDFFEPIINGIKSFIETVFNAIKNFFSEHGDTIKTIISTVWDGIKLYFETLFTALKTIFTTAWNIIKNNVQTVMNTIKGVIDGVLKAIQGIWDIFAGVFTGDWERVWEGIKGTFTGIFDAIKSVFAGAVDMGKNLIEGIWNGIKDMGGWLREKISGFFGGVLQNIKDFFGIESPSKVTADEIGEPMGQGVAVGFTQAGDAIKSAFKNTIGAAVSGGAEAVAIAQQSLVDFYNACTRFEKIDSDLFSRLFADWDVFDDVNVTSLQTMDALVNMIGVNLATATVEVERFKDAAYGLDREIMTVTDTAGRMFQAGNMPGQNALVTNSPVPLEIRQKWDEEYRRITDEISNMAYHQLAGQIYEEMGSAVPLALKKISEDMGEYHDYFEYAREVFDIGGEAWDVYENHILQQEKVVDLQQQINDQFGRMTQSGQTDPETGITAYAESAIAAFEALQEELRKAQIELAATGIEFNALGEAIKNGTVEALYDVTEGLEETGLIIRDVLINAADTEEWGKYAAQMLSEGFQVGVYDEYGNLIDAAKYFTEGIKETIETELDIHSPSGYTEWIGKMMGDGLVNSIKASTPYVIAAVDTLALNMTHALSAMENTRAAMTEAKFGSYKLSAGVTDLTNASNIINNNTNNINVTSNYNTPVSQARDRYRENKYTLRRLASG